jgi:transcription elongation factor Elf1
MAGVSRFNTFICPDCNALYQLVKVEAGPETKGHEIACRVCGVSLMGREGKSVLKYFFLREGIRRKYGGAKAT